MLILGLCLVLVVTFISRIIAIWIREMLMLISRHLTIMANIPKANKVIKHLAEPQIAENLKSRNMKFTK